MPDETGTQQTNEDPNLKHLREKAAKADEAEAALADARRENAILRAGIDTESKLGQMFVKAYDGDFADVEALKAAAKEIGVPIRGETVEETSTTTADAATETAEPTGTTERQQLAAGAVADTGESPDPRKLATDQFNADMAAGLEQDEAAGRAFNLLVNAANGGDPRVLVRERTF